MTHVGITPVDHKSHHLVRAIKNMPSSPPTGFVVAMRAKLLYVAPLPARFEWVIVSRWGPSGDHLALGWTLLPALPNEVPVNLIARQTSLAVLTDIGSTDVATSFQLAPSLPDDTTVAGDFVPAKGYVRLFGNAPSLRLVSKGQSLRPDLRPTWRIEAAHEPWFGEFIETGCQS
jgi:hypothetical protein